MCVMGGPPSLRVGGLFFCQRAVAGTLAPAKPDLGVSQGFLLTGQTVRDTLPPEAPDFTLVSRECSPTTLPTAQSGPFGL